MKSTLIQGLQAWLLVLWQRQEFFDNANIEKKQKLLELNKFSKNRNF